MATPAEGAADRAGGANKSARIDGCCASSGFQFARAKDGEIEELPNPVLRRDLN
jgi:hypothetical protein